MAEAASSYQDISTMEFNTVELPSTIEIKESVIRKGEAGAFSKVLIPKETRFGPYKGEIIDVSTKKYIDYRFAWEVFEKNSDVLKHTICAMDPALSNWMRHVNCARFYEEQNILSTQEDYSIFYVAMKDIKPGEELLTWFDPKLIKRTKRRLSKMERKPVGYTIELVPWTDEKKFVPEIIETKRARKKKVLSDMISLDEDPLLMTRTLQRLPKLPCTPKQLAQSAAYRDIYASLIQQSAYKNTAKHGAKKDRQGKKLKDQVTARASSGSACSNKSIASSPYPNVQLMESPSLGNTGSSMAKKSDLTSQVKAHQQNISGQLKSHQQNIEGQPKTDQQLSSKTSGVKTKSFIHQMETNALRRPKPRNKNRSRVCLSEMVPPKPTVIRRNEDGSTLVEDHDESYLLRDVELQVECDHQCRCLNKQQASRSLSHSIIRNEKAPSSIFVIQFSLLPEHRVVTPSNKVIYKCDVCDNAYNHAFSLKRHYLGVHINHRYLTSSDIESCQIETFHTGVHLEGDDARVCKTSPGFQAVEDITPSPVVSGFLVVNENRSCCESSDQSMTTQKVIPTLSALSKTVVNRAKNLQVEQLRQTDTIFPSVGSSKPPSSVMSAQGKVFPVTQATLSFCCQSSSDQQDPDISLIKDNSWADVNIANLSSPIKSQVKDFTLFDNCHKNPSAVSLTLNAIKPSHPDPHEAVQNLKKLCEKQLCCVDTGSSSTAEVKGQMCNTGGLLAHQISSDSLSIIGNTGDSLTNHVFPSISGNTGNSLNNHVSLSIIGNTEESLNNHVSQPISGNTGNSLTNHVSQVFSDSECVQRQFSHEKVDSLIGAGAIKNTSAVNNDLQRDEPTSSLLSSQLTSSSQSESKDSCTVSSISSKVLSLSPVNVQSLTSDCGQPSYEMDGRQTSLSTQGNKTQSDPQTTEMDGRQTSLSTQENKTQSDPQTTENIQGRSVQMTPAKNGNENGSSAHTAGGFPLCKAPPTQDPACAADSINSNCSKTSTPVTPQQVIFVTNIVFPIVTPSNMHSPTSALSQQPPQPAICSTGPNTSPTAGVPLVLISQIPHGLNTANAFLQSSTALKTFQALHQSMNVVSVGSRGSNGNLRLSSHGDMSSVSKSSVIGQTSIVCQVSGSSQLASHLISQSGQIFKSVQPGTSSAQGSSLTDPPCVGACHPPHSLAPPVKNTSLTGQPDDLYRCHMCVLLFQTMNQLKHHIKNDPHRFKGCVKQYACVQCSMRFSNKTNLIRHNLMNHQEDENFKFRCFTCGKGFSTETYLKMHARFHSGKNFPCKYGCPGVFFPNAASLVKHLRTQHAGLDLKEYTKNVKAERKKKIHRVFGLPDEQASNKVLPRPEMKDGSLPYSLYQPGIGFQAKRVKTKAAAKPSSWISSETKYMPDVASTEQPVIKEEVVIPKFQFKCKLCDRGFSTHLRLLQHRTQRHGASQSVQEYLYHMSKDVNDDDSAYYDSDHSPPPSPKTFFENVNRRGFLNMKHHIDGGPESLLSWKKHVNVEGFVSISEPTQPRGNTEAKIEWTFYNFPLYFQYQADCTQFYEEELDVPKSEVNALSQPLVSEAGLGGQISDDAGAPGQEVNEDGQDRDILTSTLKCQPEANQGSEEPKSSQGSEEPKSSQGSEEPKSSQGSEKLRSSQESVAIKREAEDCSFGVKSQERSSYIISKLEQHLQGYYRQEQPMGLADEQQIKAELVSEEEEDTNDTSKDINGTSNDQSLMPLDSITEPKTKELNVSSQDNNRVNKMTVTTCQELDTVDQNTEMKLDHWTDDDIAPAFSGLDSGISSLSSSQCPSLDCSRPESQKNLFDSRDGTKEIGVTATGQKTDAKKNISTLSMSEKLAVFKSNFMQSLNLESGPNVNHHPVKSDRSDHSLTLLQALNLHTTGCQLPVSKISLMRETNQNLRFYPSSARFLGLTSQNNEPQNSFDPVLNTSDSLKHDHRRYSIWSGQVHSKVLKDPEEKMFCCPVVETVRKQEMLRLKEQYVFEKDARDKEVEGKQAPKVCAKLDFVERMGLMTRQEFELSHHAKKQDEHIIKPPEIWKNYENIWFGKKGTITVVCSICHRHFSCWDLCLRHQLKKHPHIEPASLEMERDNDVEDLYYYYPMRYGILAQTQLIPDDLPAIEVYVCTRCGFPFKNINKLHSHMIACDPSQEEVVSSQNGNQKLKKKLLPMMDRRLHQDLDPPASKSRAGKTARTALHRQQSKLSTHQSGNVIKSLQRVPVKENPANFSNCLSFKHKNYELLYNPQNHSRRREQYKVLDQHQCHGCNLKFKSLSLLERHVKKCSGRDKLQSQKPLVSQVIPDDAALRKQHTCRYCSKRFTFIKGVDLHYKRICAVRKVKEDENQLTREDLAHEEELKRIIEHLKWSKALNKDSSDIIQGHVKVEEDGTLTRVVKSKCLKKNLKKKPKNCTSLKKLEDESSLTSSISKTNESLSNSSEDKKTKPEEVFAGGLENLGKRLTRSSSLDKISPTPGSGLKRKSSVPTVDGPPAGKKVRSLSQTSPCSTVKTQDSSSAVQVGRGPYRKHGAPSKNKSKCVQKKAPNRRVKETKKKMDKSPRKPSKTKETVAGGRQKSPAIQLPARKRGRPLKYDPSDTVNLKKKKPRSLTNQRVSGKGNGHEKRSLAKPSRIKTTLKGSKNEIRASKEKAKKTSNKKKQKVIKNNQPIDASMMIEKMKQLKEAAKLESENINKTKRANQAKRAELKKKSASKKLDKSITSRQAGLISRDLSPNKAHSTELFKHLTKASTVPETQSITVVSLKDNQLSKTPSMTTYNTLKRKSSEHTSSSPQAKKCATSPSSTAVLSRSEPRTYSTLRTISPKQMSSTILEQTQAQSSAAKSSSSQLSNPVNKQQPVSVRVVTLSPNGMNLLTYDTPPGDLKNSSTRISSPSIKVSPEVASTQPAKKISTFGIHKEPVKILGKSPVHVVVQSPEQTLQPIVKNQATNLVIQKPNQVIQKPNQVIQKPNQVIQKPNQVIQVPGLKMSTTGNHIVYKCTKSPEVDPKPVNQMIIKCADGRLMPVVPSEDVCTYTERDALSETVEKQRLSAAVTPESPLAVVNMAKSPTCHVVPKQGGVVTKPSPSLLISHPLTGHGDQLTGQGGQSKGYIKQVQVIKDGAEGETVHLINPSKLIASGLKVISQAAGASNVQSKLIASGHKVISQAPGASNLQKCAPILTPGNISIVTQPLTRQTTTSLGLPVSGKGSKLYTPPTRLSLPSIQELPKMIHGQIVPTGNKLLKLGNIIRAGASMTRPLPENVVSTSVTEKSKLLSPGQVLRVASPVLRKQPPPFPQKTPRSQVITVGRPRPSSNVHTVLVQHSPNALSQPVTIQQPSPRNIVSPPAASNIIPGAQIYSNTSKMMSHGGASSLLSNQIMISLDDGTTAMLDPDSLAQFLSMSPSLNTNDMTGANASATDPEHVMVNMAEIQPSCHVDEITWPSNGTVDLTDMPDCTGDF